MTNKKVKMMKIPVLSMILLMVALMLCFMAVSVTAEIFTDNFTRANNDTIGFGWNETVTGANVNITLLDNVALINDTSATWQGKLSHCFVSDCSEVIALENISFRYKVINTNNLAQIIFKNNESVDGRMLQLQTFNAQIRYYDGSWHDLQAMTSNVWYQFQFYDFNFTSNTYTLKIDSTEHTNLPFRNPSNPVDRSKWLFVDTTTSFQTQVHLDDVYFETTPFTPITNTAPNITVSSPSNNTETNLNESVQFTTTDDSDATTDCDLYVDTVLNQSNASVLNNTLTTFPMVWTQGLHTWYLECSDDENDTTTTGTYNLYFDDHEPNIVSGSPSITNTTIYTGYTMNFVGNVTNLNLTNVTRIILYPNATSYYVNETTSFVNATFIGWDETFNTTLEPNGVWTYSIYAEDIVQNHSHYYSFTVNNCVPDWVCSGYGACNESDLASCSSALDNNACGLPFGALGELLTDFSDQACNFCTYSLSELNKTTCDSVTDIWTVGYEDLNFGTCCNVTALPSDCAFGNVSSGLVNESCSIFNYTENDLPKAIINVIVKVFIFLSGIVVLVVVVLLMLKVTEMVQGRKK